MKRDLDVLFDLADRLAMLSHHAPACAACASPQVQVIDYFHTPALWKCRLCKHRFSFEPDQQKRLEAVSRENARLANETPLTDAQAEELAKRAT